MRVLLSCLISLLAGCANVSPITLSDGSSGHSISCHGAANSIDACLQKAGEICGTSGYSILSQNGEVIPVSFANGTYQANRQFASGQFTSSSGAMVKRSMLVKCGK